MQIPEALAHRCQRFPSRESWLAARLATIGASEAPVALGLSPYRGPWDLFDAKRQRAHIEDLDAVPTDEDTDPLTLADPRSIGQRWESRIREELALELCSPVVAPGAPFAEPDALVITHHRLNGLSWATCSPDGWTVDEGVVVPTECKVEVWKGSRWPASGSDIPGGLDFDECPIRPDYYCQVLWGMEVIDVPHAILAVLTSNYRLLWFRIRRDRDFGRKLLNAIADWREEHVFWGVEPDPDASEACVAAYRARYLGRAHGDRVIEDPADIALLRTYGNATATAKAAKKIADTVRARTIAIVGDGARVRLPSGESLTRRSDGAITAHGFAAPKQLGETIARLRPRLAPAAERVPDVEIDARDVDFSEGTDAPVSQAS